MKMQKSALAPNRLVGPSVGAILGALAAYGSGKGLKGTALGGIGGGLLGYGGQELLGRESTIPAPRISQGPITKPAAPAAPAAPIGEEIVKGVGRSVGAALEGAPKAIEEGIDKGVRKYGPAAVSEGGNMVRLAHLMASLFGKGPWREAASKKLIPGMFAQSTAKGVAAPLQAAMTGALSGAEALRTMRDESRADDAIEKYRLGLLPPLPWIQFPKHYFGDKDSTIGDAAWETAKDVAQYGRGVGLEPHKIIGPMWGSQPATAEAAVGAIMGTKPTGGKSAPAAEKMRKADRLVNFLRLINPVDEASTASELSPEVTKRIREMGAQAVAMMARGAGGYQ